jgi:hypothetical protein
MTDSAPGLKPAIQMTILAQLVLRIALIAIHVDSQMVAAVFAAEMMAIVQAAFAAMVAHALNVLLILNALVTKMRHTARLLLILVLSV